MSNYVFTNEDLLKIAVRGKNMFWLVILSQLVLLGCNKSNKGEAPTSEINTVELKKTCDAGMVQSCFKLASVERKKGNLVEATAILQKVCASGSSDGCTKLGWLEIEKENIGEAKRLLTKTCDSDDSQN